MAFPKEARSLTTVLPPSTSPSPTSLKKSPTADQNPGRSGAGSVAFFTDVAAVCPALSTILKGNLGAVPSAARLTDLPSAGILGSCGGRLTSRELGYRLVGALLGRVQGVDVFVQGIRGRMEFVACFDPSGRLAMEPITEGIGGFTTPAILGVDFHQPFAGFYEYVTVGEQRLCRRGQSIRRTRDELAGIRRLAELDHQDAPGSVPDEDCRTP